MKEKLKIAYDFIKKYSIVAIFPITVAYLEIVFNIFTTPQFSLGTLITVLFSVFYGALVYVAVSFIKNRLANKIVTAALIFLVMVPYAVEFFIYKQFKQFYDIDTVMAGSSDAVTSYFKEIISLFFEQGGIFVLLLMFVPLALYLALFREKLIPFNMGGIKKRLITFASGTLSLGLALLIIFTSPVYGPVYTKQYNFQSATSMGLATALRLDLQNKIFSSNSGFEVQDTPSDVESSSSEVTSSSVSQEETEPEPEYGENKLDIDFEALNSKANSKQKELNNYVSSLPASKKNEYTGIFKGKNLIMISAEAFSAAVIDKDLTPTLYRLATKGINFTDYYQPASAGTTGGEYQNIFGMLPTAGGKSFKNTADNYNYFTMGSQLNRLGYYGKAFHNNTYTYYDRHLTHKNLGYSDGYMGYGNGMEDIIKWRWPQSDDEMISGTLPTYIDNQPFNVYYMSVSGHSGYSKSGNAMTAKHWEKVKDLPYSDAVKGYFAANLDLELALTNLVNTLEEKGIADDTVICISADHFPYGLDSGGSLGNMPYLSELYGKDVKTYFDRDYSRLIIWSGCLEKEEPIIVDTPTFSLDILPTLSNLFGTEFDSRFMVGRDVFSDAPALVFNANYDFKTELGTYYSSSGKFVPASEDTVIPEGYVNSIKTTVRNKMRYCSLSLDIDYFRHVFA